MIDDSAHKRRNQEQHVEALQEKLEEYESQRNRFANEVHELNVNLVKTSGELSNLEAELQSFREKKKLLKAKMKSSICRLI